MVDLRYPTGPFSFDPAVTAQTRRSCIARIAGLPAAVEQAVAGLREDRIDTPYRPGGWTVRQVVHHLADSHMNAYVRFKLALTEDSPTIRPYDEAAWARLADSERLPVGTSLTLLTALHARWVTVLDAMSDADFTRALVHPERGPMTVDVLLQMYAWHGGHHTAHVTALRAREGW